MESTRKNSDRKGAQEARNLMAALKQISPVTLGVDFQRLILHLKLREDETYFFHVSLKCHQDEWPNIENASG